MEQTAVATSPHQHITITSEIDTSAEDAIRAAQLPRSVEPSASALVEVAADLERLDQAPETELDALLAGLPEPGAHREAAEPLPALTPEQEAAYERAFAEAYPEVMEAWQADGEASTKVQGARVTMERLAAAPGTLEAIDEIADAAGLAGDVRLFDALARAGARAAWGGVVGGPIGETRIAAYESADTKQALQEAMADGVMPADTMLLWANNKLGNSIAVIMNARRGAAHLARVAPEVVELAIEQGLHRDPRVWRRLAALGGQLPRKGTTMQQTKPAAQSSSVDEATVRAQLEHLMKDPKYWDSARRDPAYVRKIEQGFAKLYGGQK